MTMGETQLNLNVRHKVAPHRPRRYGAGTGGGLAEFAETVGHK